MLELVSHIKNAEEIKNARLYCDDYMLSSNQHLSSSRYVTQEAFRNIKAHRSNQTSGSAHMRIAFKNLHFLWTFFEPIYFNEFLIFNYTSHETWWLG